MQIQEYKFIYNDLKQQIKEIPPLQNLLRLTEKSTKKLQCLNLYSIVDKRQFDLELEQEQIMREILSISQGIREFKKSQLYSSEDLNKVNVTIQQLKIKNIETFDLLNKQDQLLTKDVEVVQYSLEDHQEDDYTRIKEEDEFEQENGLRDSNPITNTNQQRVNYLKKQIQEIINKINKTNNGRGKWYVSDHNDFVKIYNKFVGKEKRIVQEGAKMLGMKNTQIMDHLELYQNYLMLQKEKKTISQEYKQIKALEKMEQDQMRQKQKKSKEEKKKVLKQKEIEENEKKRQMIQKYREKKEQQKTRLLQQEEKQKKQKEKLSKVPLPPSKKKQILQRNQKFITDKQNHFKNVQSSKEKVVSSLGVRTSSIGKQLNKPTSSISSKKNIPNPNQHQ